MVIIIIIITEEGDHSCRRLGNVNILADFGFSELLLDFHLERRAHKRWVADQVDQIRRVVVVQDTWGLVGQARGKSGEISVRWE